MSGDVIAAALEAVLIPVAQSRNRLSSTAATPEEVDTIAALSRLGQLLPDFCRRAILGETGSDQWAALAETLRVASRTCNRHVIIEVHDIGDAGGR